MTRPVVKVIQGELRGAERTTTKGTKYLNFKGIPFAEPPVGPLRFKAPVPIKPWDGIKDALKEGNHSLQIDFFNPEKVLGNEDCLYLNVYTPSLPRNDGKDPLSVMVYIHGGGFAYGSGDEEDFGPEFFLDKNIILVTTNYRLGIYGFLCLDSPDVPGNAGLKDQYLALQWVKENVKYFNGDENNITIFGGSAGSASVEYQLISPMSHGLFHKAIMQSGSVLNPWARNIEPKHLVELTCKGLGIECNDPENVLKELQKMDANQVIKASLLAIDDKTVKLGTLFGFAPVVEKSFKNIQGFLTSEPLEQLKAGNFENIPTIIGLCSNEGSTFPLLYQEAHCQNIRKHEYADYMKSYDVKNEKEVNEKLTSLYRQNAVHEKKQLTDFLSDNLFVSGIHQSLKYRAKYNNKVFGYLFSFVGNLKFAVPNIELDYSESPHTGEATYLAKFKESIPSEDNATPRDHLMRDRMVELWTSFAKTGNPTDEGSKIPTKWLPTTEKDMNILEINDEFRMIPFPWQERIKIWESFYL